MIERIEKAVVFAFDTLSFAKYLRETGFTEEQAEGLAEAQVALMKDNLSTKADIKALEL